MRKKKALPLNWSCSKVTSASAAELSCLRLQTGNAAAAEEEDDGDEDTGYHFFYLLSAFVVKSSLQRPFPSCCLLSVDSKHSLMCRCFSRVSSACFQWKLFSRRRHRTQGATLSASRWSHRAHANRERRCCLITTVTGRSNQEVHTHWLGARGGA